MTTKRRVNIAAVFGTGDRVSRAMGLFVRECRTQAELRLADRDYAQDPITQPIVQMTVMGMLTHAGVIGDGSTMDGLRLMAECRAHSIDRAILAGTALNMELAFAGPETASDVEPSRVLGNREVSARYVAAAAKMAGLVLEHLTDGD